MTVRLTMLSVSAVVAGIVEVCDACCSGVVFVMGGSMLFRANVESRDDEMATSSYSAAIIIARLSCSE